MKLFHNKIHAKGRIVPKKNVVNQSPTVTNISWDRFVNIAISTGISAVLISSSMTTLSPREIFQRYSQSVVTISAIGVERDPFSPRELIENVMGTGSGFAFIDSKYIITNAHVIDNAMLVKVDGNEAKVLGVDIQNDIAVLQIDKQNDRSMTPLKKCTSMPKIGDPVIAIGNPFGFEKTVTSGIISGIHRSLDSVDKFPLIDLIQTDASINPGNSGGPLLDGSNGCVLGVNTAIVSSSGASSGLGFSIPIDTVEQIANDIISGKEETDVSIGVSVLPDTYAHGLGVKGVVIADVMPESIASKIGLEGTRRDQYGRPYIGDIIVGINDEKIEKRSDLYRILRELKKDDVIELVVLRSIGIVRFTIQL